MYQAVHEKIDAVITWVDGSDPRLREKRMNYAELNGAGCTTQIPVGKSETRFLDNGELYFCLKLLKKNAPWLDRIFIVTDGQIPGFLADDIYFEKKCIVVDHSEIFRGYDSCLPTFNSRSIESMIWRIPGLSEKFIYLNDDFFLVNKVKPLDFFRDGKVVLRGNWRVYIGVETFQLLLERMLTFMRQVFQKKTRTMHLLAQKKGARLAGFNYSYFRVPHTPHPMLKSNLERYFNENPEVLKSNICFRFRSYKQFWPVSLSDHLNIKNGHAVLDQARCWAEFNGEVDGAQVISSLEQGIANNRVKFLCVTALEKCSKSIRGLLEEMIKRFLI